MLFLFLCNSCWEIMLCDCCGSQGTHIFCSQLRTALDDWMCSSCSAVVSKGIAGIISNHVTSAQDDHFLWLANCTDPALQLTIVISSAEDYKALYLPFELQSFPNFTSL